MLAWWFKQISRWSGWVSVVRSKQEGRGELLWPSIVCDPTLLHALPHLATRRREQAKERNQEQRKITDRGQVDNPREVHIIISRRLWMRPYRRAASTVRCSSNSPPSSSLSSPSSPRPRCYFLSLRYILRKTYSVHLPANLLDSHHSAGSP